VRASLAMAHLAGHACGLPAALQTTLTAMPNVRTSHSILAVNVVLVSSAMARPIYSA
jgi:hypothetical protein